MSSLTIKNVFVCILCASLSALSWRVFVAIGEVKPEIVASVKEGRRAATTGADYLQFQTELFKSDPYQKSLKASLDTPAVANGTFRLINTKVMPLVMKNLSSLDSNQAVMREDLVRLGNAMTALEVFIRNTDQRITQELLPAITVLATRLGTDVPTLLQAFADLVREGKLGVEQVNRLIADPRILEVLDHLVNTSTHIDEATGYLRDSAKRIPEMADHLVEITKVVEKLLKTTSKWQRALLIAQLVSILSGLRR